NDTVYKVFEGSTGGLLKHLKRYHKAEHQRARLASTHSRLRVAADGTITELYTFEEALEKHISFVLFVVLDVKHFQLSRSEAFRTYSSTLDPRYVPSSRATSAKLMLVIKALMFSKLFMALHQAKTAFGDPFAGLQSDIWSPKDNKTSYVCTRLSFVHTSEDLSKSEVTPILGFDEFPENRHTGSAISRQLKKSLQAVKLDMETSITLPTLDGAANNKRAFKIMKKRVKLVEMVSRVLFGFWNEQAGEEVGS
ncbi:hypothetical protein CYMTET_45461, partial [Cymbomonas tetramitiformis]